MKFRALIMPAKRSAMEKRNSTEAFFLLDVKWSIAYAMAVAVLNENHRTGIVAGKSFRRPTQVKTRQSKGTVFFIQKPCPSLSPLL